MNVSYAFSEWPHSKSELEYFLVVTYNKDIEAMVQHQTGGHYYGTGSK